MLREESVALTLSRNKLLGCRSTLKLFVLVSPRSSSRSRRHARHASLLAASTDSTLRRGW